MSDKKPRYKDIHPKGWGADNVAWAFITDQSNGTRATLYDFFEQPYHLIIASSGGAYRPNFIGGPGKFQNGMVDDREPTDDDFGVYEVRVL